MRSRLTSERFIGRIGELSELELAVGEVRGGRSALVLLGGDSGVGKTRLVAELERRLTELDDPPLVLRGEGVESSDGELPYAPLLGLLRPLARSDHAAIGRLDAATRGELATLLPGIGADGEAPSERRHDGSGQVRLFEALRALFEAVSDDGPVVLVVEDAHWADASTRAFLAFLARGLRTEPIMLLLTYRADELHRRHPLRPMLSELERLERARRIELEPFDRDELTEALADILGAAPDAALLNRLLERGEGNPLFTEELLAASLDGRGAPPRSLSDAFLRRIERLGEEAQRVVRAVAIGRELDEAALQALTGLDTAAVQTGLREALTEQVLVAESTGAFRFRHALLRESVYDDLLPGERGALHLALARHLEDGPPPPGSDELSRSARVAYHFSAAGDQPAALRATVGAGRRAARAEAWVEAADLFSHALELWPRVPDAERLAGVDHVELLWFTARSLFVIDERTRAEPLLRAAMDELDSDAAPVRRARLLIDWGRLQWSMNRGAEGVAAAERALAVLPADDDPRLALAIRAWLARVQTLRGRFREALAGGEEALALADGAPATEAELLNTLGMARVGVGDVEAGLDLLRRSLALCDATGDLDRRATCTANLSDMLGHVGRTADALRVAREGLAHVPPGHVRNHDWLSATVTLTAFRAGDWELARASLAPAPERSIGILLILFHLAEASVLAGIGGADDAETARQRLDAISGLVCDAIEPQWIGPYGALSGELYARAGELDAARREVQAAIDRLEVCTDDVTYISWVTLVGIRVEADRAQRARDLGDARDRREATTRAKLHLDRITAAAQDGGPVEAAEALQAKAEMRRARGTPSAAAWARAADGWAGLERPYEEAIARWRLAEAHVSADGRDAACAAARDALAIADRLGSDWLARELRRLAVRARLDVVVDADARGPADAAEAPAVDPFGLTDRERQVLALVAEGATNKQIGTQLYMAEKTASVHVSRILAKLGVHSRTEAAAVAHRQALV